MDEDYQQPSAAKKVGKQHNTLPLWGNESTMNLNPLILANIQGSSYFKVHLFKLKTYHEVVDEIYYQVKHMEPWERGSRKTSGQTGMCGGVRGVGAGGIVSTAYCLLYKLYTLRLTRKQVNGLLNHTDSPYIRALGFMYLRYTQPPADLYDWYEDYLQDEEEIDVKAGGGQVITVGQMVYQFLTKLDWFSTLFPRIPVPIQKQIEKRLEQYCRDSHITLHQLSSARSNATGAGASVPAASVGGSGGGCGSGGGSGGGAAYEYDDAGYERRSGGGGSGAGVVAASSSRDVYVGRSAVPPPASSGASSYRGEHDDREYRSSSAYRHRRREESPSNECHSSRDRERAQQHHHREKHKKKHKHKHHSRSRSRSHSHNRGRSARKRERERDWAHEREQRDKERDRDRDRDFERRARELDERRFR